ncbi:MAG TPA: hypothetical protein VMB52_03600 [Verrucomicrobiae bacterium]|nr:hypothetical protein [Verrucomicrobiae bacterium]
MTRIDTITYTFPNNTKRSQEFFTYLLLLLKTLPNSDLHEDRVLLHTSRPSDSLPVTVFEQQGDNFPRMHIGSDPKLELVMGNFAINPDIMTQKRSWTEAGGSDLSRLTLKELYEKLNGHLVRIDHTGVNIPTILVTKEKWLSFVKRVAAQSNLYNYFLPEKPWLFLLPATQTEFDSDIGEFPSGRDPKCELVYDEYTKIPVIQVDIETDLTRNEVERLIPDPYGISFPELADYFRTVYVNHPWPGLNIRFDVRFRSDEPGRWETGEWLVKDGKRIR